MWYRYDLTVPRGTEKADTERKPIQLPEGVVTKVRVRFPPGPRGQVFTAVFQGVHKMWPRGYGTAEEPPVAIPALPGGIDRPGAPSWAWGDDESIEMDEYVKNIKGWHYTLEGYAPDTSYDHTIWWDFNILEKEYAETWGPIQELVRLLKDLIGL